MLENLFDNIYVIIPIAVVIGIRILSAWQKRQAAAAKDSPAETHGYKDEDGAAPYFESSPPPVPQPAHQNARAPAAKPAQKIADAPKAPAGTGAAFPHNLDYLPPLNRAVVFSEILGPPKADI
jgi:hypothetical protein